MPARLSIESPEERFGFHVGSDRKLVRWGQMLDYFRDLATTSDRHQIGNDRPHHRRPSVRPPHHIVSGEFAAAPRTDRHPGSPGRPAQQD